MCLQRVKKRVREKKNKYGAYESCQAINISMQESKQTIFVAEAFSTSVGYQIETLIDD